MGLRFLQAKPRNNPCNSFNTSTPYSCQTRAFLHNSRKLEAGVHYLHLAMGEN